MEGGKDSLCPWEAEGKQKFHPMNRHCSRHFTHTCVQSSNIPVRKAQQDRPRSAVATRWSAGHWWSVRSEKLATAVLGNNR